MYNILFIGIGKMGSPMAGYLSKKHDVSIYNRTKSKCDNWIKNYKGKVMAEFVLPEPKAKSDFVLPEPKPVMPPENFMDNMMKEEGFQVADKPAFILPEPKKSLYENVFDTVQALTEEPLQAGAERFMEAYEGDMLVFEKELSERIPRDCR